MSKRKHKDKHKHKRAPKPSTTNGTQSNQSIEGTGLVYILPTKNPRNLRNLEQLPSDVNRLPTRKEVSRKKHGLPSYCQLILMPMFSAMSKITNNLYLTSVGGMTQENFDKHKIGCIINATYEAPNLKQPGIESIRVPVDDSEKDNIAEFFDLVADKINEKTIEKVNVVVHCVAGISRSTTLVMAYLLKYHRMDVRSAFNHIHLRRPVARPNNAFFRQLINYEMKLFGKTSCKMIHLRINDADIEVPDFFQHDHKGFIVLESLKQSNRLKRKQAEAKKASQNVEETASQPLSTDEQTPRRPNSPNSSLDRTADDPEPRIGIKDEKRKEDLIKRFVVDFNEETESSHHSAQSEDVQTNEKAINLERKEKK